MKLQSYLLPAGMLLAGAAALFTGLLPWPAFQELAGPGGGRGVGPAGTVPVAPSLGAALVDDSLAAADAHLGVVHGGGGPARERLRTHNVEIRWCGFAVDGLAAVVLTVPLAVVALWLSTGMH